MATALLPESTLREVLPLDLLRVGESGKIVEIVGPVEWKHRLEELGLREGCEVRVVKSGEPCILAVGGHRLSFRPDAGTMILVEASHLGP